MLTTLLNLLHFNDVYRVSKQKLQSGDTIDVCQFAERVNVLRSAWPKESGGLLLFSGDLFSPSVESSVTRGSHMVPVINMIAPDIALTGNHDFDFGYPHLLNLIGDCHFPWILSNIIDSRTSKTPEGLETFRTFERGGVKIGVIGLVEKNWITTVPGWPPHFVYRDMHEVGIELSQLLRGNDHECDVILALTHSRLPNDISLARSLFARPAGKDDIASEHGVDILFGGHDHTYYIGKGAESWDTYHRVEGEAGTEADDGILLVKSGTDFRDLSEMVIELEDTPSGSVRRKVVKSLRGKRHQITPGDPASKDMEKLLESILTDVSSSLSAPVCYTLEEWDVRSEIVRMDESSFGNWIADVIRHAYDDAIFDLGDHKGGADGVMLCGGALRGDSRYGPGKITIGDVLEILPFSDPVLVIEMDGQSIWDAFEAALSMWPAQEGRFPVISGFRIEWDSRKTPGDRILGIWLSAPNPKEILALHPELTPDEAIKGEAIPRQSGGKQYKVVTRQYMYEGHDGCDALVGKHCLVDDESGVIMSAIVRKFLLGSQYIHKMKQLTEDDVSSRRHQDEETESAINRAREEWKKQSPLLSRSAANKRWLEITHKVLQASQEHSEAVIADALRICRREHMSDVDAFDGSRARKFPTSLAQEAVKRLQQAHEEDLVTVKPVLDGRLRDVARPREHHHL
ncbi:Metallo-dependent phosphatase [Clavulina sp. PMI_390]|nr:Metallo-dependent phosphatase [Clavulina sp. PMI_390]